MQNCRNSNPYMRRANCGCSNNSCNSNNSPCMSTNDGRNQSIAAAVYRERSGCCDRDDVLDGMPIAMAYVPWQNWNHIYESGKGFQRGTIFEELDLPFRGRGGCNS